MFFAFSFPILAIIIGLVIYTHKNKEESFSRALDAIENTASTTDGSIQYTMTKTQSGLYEYPVIVDYKNEVTMQQVNEDIENTYYDFDCWNTGGENNGSVVLSVDFAQNDVLSITEDGWYTCGERQVDKALRTVTFDLRSGDVVGFTELFSNFELHKEEILTTIYSDVIYGAELYARQGQEEEGLCNDGMHTLDALMNAPWHNFQIIPFTRSIVITPAYPWPRGACSPNMQISIDDILPFASEDSLLRRF